MGFKVLFGGLVAFLGLQPFELELLLNVVDHDGLAFTTAILAPLSGRVGTLELEVLILVLQVLLAVALPEDAVDLLDSEVFGEQFISSDNVLYHETSSVSVQFDIYASSRAWG